MPAISQCIEEAIERVRQSGGVLDIEPTAQQITAECGAPDRIDEIAETLLQEAAHQGLAVKMDHLAAKRDRSPPQS